MRSCKDLLYFISTQVESGDWWEHVRGFYKNKRDMTVLFMKYEDMHADGVAGNQGTLY